jgi:hypothetical protein
VRIEIIFYFYKRKRIMLPAKNFVPDSKEVLVCFGAQNKDVDELGVFSQ